MLLLLGHLRRPLHLHLRSKSRRRRGRHVKTHTNHLSIANHTKLPMSAEEFIKRTPIISADGEVLLGSKNTTAFLVDAKSGAVIYAFGSADHSAIGAQSAEENAILPRKDVEGWVESEVEQPLYVIRTDYVLKYFSRKTGKELWYLRFAEIETSFQCQEAGNYFGEGSPNPEDDFGPELKGDDELPLTCQRRAVVYRIRDHSLLEQLLGSDRLPNTHPGVRLPPLPAPDLNPLLKSLVRLSEVHQNKAGKAVLALPPPETEYFGILSLHRGGSGKMYTSVAPEIVHQNKAGQVVLALPPPKTEDFGILSLHRGGAGKMYTSVAPEILAASHMWYFVVFVVLLSFIVAFLFYVSPLAVVEKVKLNKWSEKDKVQAMMSKKKKARKSGIHKNSAGIEPSWEDVSHETMVGDTNGLLENPHVERTVRKSQLTFFNPVDGSIDGRKIGKLFVTNKEIAKGSNGTIVLEGIYDGRPVAVKRLVRTHHDVALKEIQNLIASDFHPNIVRWYGVEFDQDFVYLSLERCTCNLGELIFSYSCTLQNQIKNKDQDPNFFDECTIRLHSTIENKDFELWKANGHPSSQLLKLMRDIVSGLAHLHELGIIHRDLKPQNVLIIKGRSICAKLSDMGISKRLPGNMSSLTQSATGCGSSGWQAPEQLRHERQTRAVDLFGLGCVLFFCLTGGQHPFGDSYERDLNIVNNQKDLFLIDNIPEAMDLISHLLDPDPNLRPKAVDVLHHPLFWNAEMRLSFLRDASDRVELEDRESESELLNALESIAPVALGGKWDEKMESAFISAHIDDIFKDFTSYKVRVPVTGAIILDESYERCLLVKGWKGTSWSFPRGKKNKDEEDHTCAVREVLEETGFDVSKFLNNDEYIEMIFGQQRVRLYIVAGVKDDTAFAPLTKKEISEIAWHRLDELQPANNDVISRGITGLKLYMVAPFLASLEAWISAHQPPVAPKSHMRLKGISVWKAKNSSTGSSSMVTEIQQTKPVVEGPSSDMMGPGKSFRNFRFDTNLIFQAMETAFSL